MTYAEGGVYRRQTRADMKPIGVTAVRWSELPVIDQPAERLSLRVADIRQS